MCPYQETTVAQSRYTVPMCGRFAQYTPPGRLARQFEISETKIRIFDARPRYNVAPTQPVLAVRLDPEGEREMVPLTWGLLPFWAKESKLPYSTINARAETVADKPAYRQPFRKRRCLIPADFFTNGKRKERANNPMRLAFNPENRSPWQDYGTAGRAMDRRSNPARSL